VAPLLARHPDRDLVICLAGCGGTSIVAIRRRGIALVSAELVTTSGSGEERPSSGDVICVAGCTGAPGMVVYRNARLTWLEDDAGTRIAAHLRTIADRIVAAGALDIETFPRRWVSEEARHKLSTELLPANERLAFAGQGAASLLSRLAGAAGSAVDVAMDE
jgi:hypothetical protein